MIEIKISGNKKADLIQQISDIFYVLTKGEKPEAKSPAPKKEEPKKEEPKKAPSGYTIEDIRAEFAKHNSREHRDQLKGILAGLGVNNVSSIPESAFSQVMEELKKLGG